ncbi:pyridoxal-phosphate dependent enzyme [Escherichia coli]
MADSQPLSGAPEGAEYLRAVLRAPVYEAAQVTPLQKMEKLSSRLDNVILVKREDRQPVHSFTLRGAYAMMAGLTEEQKAHGVITASAGNHAQGVAFFFCAVRREGPDRYANRHRRHQSRCGTWIRRRSAASWREL